MAVDCAWVVVPEFVRACAWHDGRRNAFGYTSAGLAFDCGAEILRFGAGVDIAQARYRLAKMTTAKPKLSASAN